MSKVCCFSYNNALSEIPPRWARTLICGRDFVNSCGTSIKCGAAKVANFVITNRYNLLSYAIAWAVILCSIGMLHGFKTTTAPFSIGMGVGVGIGLLGPRCRSADDRSASCATHPALHLLLRIHRALSCCPIPL